MDPIQRSLGRPSRHSSALRRDDRSDRRAPSATSRARNSPAATASPMSPWPIASSTCEPKLTTAPRRPSSLDSPEAKPPGKSEITPPSSNNESVQPNGRSVRPMVGCRCRAMGSRGLKVFGRELEGRGREKPTRCIGFTNRWCVGGQPRFHGRCGLTTRRRPSHSLGPIGDLARSPGRADQERRGAAGRAREYGVVQATREPHASPVLQRGTCVSGS